MKLTLVNQYDFLGRFFRLAIANILSNIMVPLAGLVDAAFLGHLPDIRHLAGVLLASILFSYLYRVMNFLRFSTNAMTAQAVGRNDPQEMLLVGLRHGLIALGLGVTILIMQYPVQKLGFVLLSATPEVKASGVAYFNARIWEAPAALLNFVLMGWFLGREMSGYVVLTSLIGNVANIVLDYLMIIRWGWESSGAGLATAISQYLALLVGLILVGFKIQWRDLSAITQKVFDRSTLKTTFALNRDLLVRTLAFISTFAIFSDLSSAMGTTFLAENGLLLQVVILCIFVVQGVGYATQTLTGNLKGKGSHQQLVPLIAIAVFTSLLLALPFAGVSILFPQSVFGLLTNHTEVTEQIGSYASWLLPVLEFASMALMLEGYFVGLTEGKTLRNSALAAIGVGFLPMAFVAWYFHSNHVLWLAFSLYMVTNTVILGVQLPRTFTTDVTGEDKLAA